MYLDSQLNSGANIKNGTAIGEVKFRFDGVHLYYLFAFAPNSVPCG